MRGESTGTFYTPRRVTAFLVRRTLEPLVRESNRRRDPAAAGARSGDGQRRLPRRRLPLPGVGRRGARWSSRAAGTTATSTPADRAALRREIAQRCLFGVDLNPMAVQLARLSIWLATPGVRQAAHLSRPSPRRRQQPDRRDAWTTCGGSRPAARAGRAGRSRCRSSRTTSVSPMLQEAVAHAPEACARAGRFRRDRSRKGDRRSPRSRPRLAARSVVGGARPVVRRLVLGGRLRTGSGAVQRTCASA